MKKFYRVSIFLLVAVVTLGFYLSVGAQTPPLISVKKIAHPIAMPPGLGTVTYDYTVLNVGTTVIANVTLTDDSCPSVSFISGDTNGNAKLETMETWEYRCITTISQTTTNTAVVTGQADGFTAVDTANATVFVGVPLPPPIIHLVITPDVFVLPPAGGGVTYTYTVTNPGPAPLSNVTVVDDKCTGLPGRVSGYSGDLNQNKILESNETWTFTCQTNLNQTTLNTGTAEGSGSGLTATDSSSVTVVVSTPGLPNTGFPFQGESSLQNIIILTGIFIILLSLYAGRKKLEILSNKI